MRSIRKQSGKTATNSCQVKKQIAPQASEGIPRDEAQCTVNNLDVPHTTVCNWPNMPKRHVQHEKQNASSIAKFPMTFPEPRVEISPLDLEKLPLLSDSMEHCDFRSNMKKQLFKRTPTNPYGPCKCKPNNVTIFFTLRLIQLVVYTVWHGEAELAARSREILWQALSLEKQTF